MKKEKACFTFRLPEDLNEYAKQKAKAWKSSKNAALVRIVNEHMQSDSDKSE